MSNPFKTGDKVTPISSTPIDANEPPIWMPRMDVMIGKIGTVHDPILFTPAFVQVQFELSNGATVSFAYKPTWLVLVTEQSNQKSLSWAEEEIILRKKRDDIFKHIFN